jgi:outer membrane protein assembly factor BamA
MPAIWITDCYVRASMLGPDWRPELEGSRGEVPLCTRRFTSATMGALFALAVPTACTSVPQGRVAVASIEIRGERELSEGDIESRIATRESPRFLGLFPELFYDPEVYNPYLLEADLKRIERYYQARGFYAARVRQGLARNLDPQHVEVQIEVQENAPTHVRQLSIRAIERLPSDVVSDLHAALDGHLAIGDRFEEVPYVEAASAMQRALTDRGYADAKVERRARVDVPRFVADVTFDVSASEPAVLGEVRLHGLGTLPEAPVRRALDLTPGEPFSTSELEDAQQATLELGVFSSVVIRPRPEQRSPGSAAVPIDVELSGTPLQALRLGGGVQLDTLQTGAHLLAGYDHQNFLGGLRRLSLEVRPRSIFYPTRLDNLDLPDDLLPELGALATLRQPGFLEARTLGTLRAQYNIYAVLNALSDGVDVLGYREARVAGALDRPFGRHLRLQPSHNVQTNVPFAYLGDLGDELDSLVISYSELLLTIDFRDSVLSPHRGARLLVPLQVAGLGGDAADWRLQPELSAFVPLGAAWTFALRGSAGALLPFNYSRPESTGRDAQILFFRGFFAGGPTSNRGYPQRGIGPHGALPFLYVGGVNPCEAAGSSVDECSVALGGLSIWEASAEFRYALGEALNLALFCDAADVTRRRLGFSLARPHLSCGPGLRYATPVGPIRADLGVRIPDLQVLAGAAAEPEPPQLLGLPIALTVGIGQAF